MYQLIIIVKGGAKFSQWDEKFSVLCLKVGSVGRSLSTSKLFRCLVLIATKTENPFSHKWVVENGI